MEEEILKLIYDYSSPNSKISVYMLVERLIEIVVNKRELEDYVLDFSFKTLEEYTFSIYNFLHKKILIDIDSINKYLKVIDYYGSEFEKNLFNNLYMVGCILHELEHAMQLKKYESTANQSLEAILIRGVLSQQFKILKLINDDKVDFDKIEKCVDSQIKMRQENYAFNPVERMAEIKARETIVATIEPLGKKFPFLYQLEKNFLTIAMIDSYAESLQLGKCPTELYFSNMHQKEVWTGLDFYSKNPKRLKKKVIKMYDLHDRLLYGLPILEEDMGEKSLILNR